jgi:Domain of unknown function (DUF4091)
MYDLAIGGREGALVIVRSARTVTVSASGSRPGGVSIHLFFAHFVSVDGRLVPDALEPWDGSARQTEQPNQPVLVQVEAPYGARSGVYTASVAVTADGRTTSLPLRVKVFPVTLPAPGTRVGNLLTSFNLGAQAYVSKAAELYGFGSNPQRSAANRALFGFLGDYRISPASWGFGEPRSPLGYQASPKWWLDSAGNFVGQLAASPGFSAMRLPISSNRTSRRSYIAGLSPFQPESWCGYLGQVRSFWEQHQALRPSSIPYLYGFDEPDSAGQRLVARQARVAHRCFPGAQELMTGNPSRANSFLWDGKHGDDVDIWSVLSRRYYGKWTSPARSRSGHSRTLEFLRGVDEARARGKMIWSYTYSGPGTPGFAATEPLSDPRMFLLWNALEGIQGVLYAQGMTTYTKQNPLDAMASGEAVLLYPGSSGPIPSARLEQIRDGIEDWAIFNIVRQRRGAGAVRAILGSAGLFSSTRAGVRLACTIGCELKSSTSFAWPRWSHDATTPRRIDAARLAALEAAGGG